MAEVNDKLQSALKQAKTKKMFFAFVAKGGGDGVLLVAASKIPPKDIAEAKKKSGGTTVTTGRCFGEEGELVFETAKEPPAALAGQIKKVAARDAGLTLKVVARGGGEAEEEKEETATPPVAPPQPPTHAAEPELVKQVTATLAHLAPAIKAAVAAHPDHQKDVLGAAARAQAGAKNNQPGDVKAALMQLNNLLKELGGAAAPPPVQESPARKEEEEEEGGRHEWEEVKKVLMEDVKKAIAAAPAHKDRLLKLLAAATNHEKAGDYAAALDVADELFEALEEAAGGEAEEPLPEIKDVTVDAPALWRAAKEKVDGQISALQAALKKTGRPGMARIAEFGLNGITGGLQVRLQAALLDVAAASEGEGLVKAKAKALAAAEEYDKFLQGDEVVALCEKNPCGVKVAIRPTMSEALGRLRKALAAR